VKTFNERLYADHGQYLGVESILCVCRSEYQDVLVFENPTFGTVLVLDGVVQLTELDNHIYHEMIAHVPLLAHGCAKNVLIIGGGDGGTLKQVLKHPVESVTLVELDAKVVEISRRYLPLICGDAFADPRVSMVIGDGAQYVVETDDRFDIIIVDSTDPVGRAKALFADRFYAACQLALENDGLIAIQSGCPFYMGEETERTLGLLIDRFGAARPYLAPVPTYANGSLALMVAGAKDNFIPAINVLNSRMRMSCLDTDYYSPEVHHAAFAMPPHFARPSSKHNPEEHSTMSLLPDWIGQPVRQRKPGSRVSP
jgi:spermidine synthase